MLSLYDTLEQPAKDSQSMHPLLRFSAEIILPDFIDKFRVSTQIFKMFSIHLPIKQSVITKKSCSLTMPVLLYFKYLFGPGSTGRS